MSHYYWLVQWGFYSHSHSYGRFLVSHCWPKKLVFRQSLLCLCTSRIHLCTVYEYFVKGHFIAVKTVFVLPESISVLSMNILSKVILFLSNRLENLLPSVYLFVLFIFLSQNWLICQCFIPPILWFQFCCQS